MRKATETPMTFEETYPRYPYSDLVRLGIAVARLIVRRKRRHERLAAEKGSGARSEADATFPSA